ncbi:hypothetical protein [Streptomyces oceani]|uniref:Uncharacterized protein n=1 Tax=Streptomyces oceani TaxID=1075402 RepID=A0A1E7JYY6_9ACTN|nr:hypothetical protein [Streptomyces oceani]OEU96923.1 hypothetical protein AN216_18425 [Streptomyces oceani]
MKAAPWPSGPAPDASVVPLGRNRVLLTLPAVVLLLAPGGAGLFGAWAAATGQPSVPSNDVGTWAGIVFLLALGVLGAAVLLAVWRVRHQRLVADDTGLWLLDGRRHGLVPWASLAGAGLYWSRMRWIKAYTLELCPSVPVRTDDPVLWSFVRDAEPLRPGLPDTRYRVPVPPGTREAVERLVRPRVAPSVWFGEVEQAVGYGGRPARTASGAPRARRRYGRG